MSALEAEYVSELPRWMADGWEAIQIKIYHKIYVHVKALKTGISGLFPLSVTELLALR